jgi:hypothetical protein
MFSLIICSFLFIELSSAQEILSDEDLKDKFVTVVKDNEIEKQLQSSSEVQECLQKAKFDPKEDKTKRNEKAKEAEKCFAEKLKKQGPEKLKELSSQLQLENFGLINSSSAKEITEYLTDKLHKAMTGVDRKEQKRREAFNLKNKKIVDQKDFFELYTNHLAKNVMFEISRFCFEHLRIAGGNNDTSFASHWGSILNDSKAINVPVNDNGNGEFGKDIDVSDTKTSYEGMFKGITGSGNFSTKRMGDFFNFCTSQIKPLCDKFKTDPSIGANACLTLGRLQNARKVIKDTEKVKEIFEKEMSAGALLELNQTPNFFVAQGETSFDNLTSITSYDVLEGGKIEDSERLKMAEKCSKQPESPECEKFLVIDDSLAKVEFNTQITESFKKQAEIARIIEMQKQKDNKKLKEYLEDQGYFDLAKNIDSLDEATITSELEKIFDAKTSATLKQISEKVGKRQMSEEDSKDPKTKESNIQQTADETLKERARMAQVVLFNNILVSFVEAEEKSTGKKRKYGTSWKREKLSLETDAQGKVDESLFSGFEQSFQDSSEGSGNESITDVSFLDAILGKENPISEKTK